MDLGLTGHRALVGGGSGGLGGAIATALRAEGAAVALVARESARLTDQAARLDASAVPADLSTPDGPAAAVAGSVAALGGLDLLVVNTGGPPPGRFADLDEAAWAKAIDGTLLSTVRLIRAALPALREGRDPAILVILSSSVREPIPGLVTSNAIRPGLAGLVKSLVDEIAPIRINALAPGRLATGRIAELDATRAATTGETVEEIQRATIARIPLGSLWRSGGARARRRVPAVPGGLVRDGRDRAGGRRDDPGAPLAGCPRWLPSAAAGLAGHVVGRPREEDQAERRKPQARAVGEDLGRLAEREGARGRELDEADDEPDPAGERSGSGTRSSGRSRAGGRRRRTAARRAPGR